jgi:hypothetical protein
MPDLCIRGCGRERRAPSELRAFVGQGAEQLQDAALRARITVAAFEAWGSCQECAQGIARQLLTAQAMGVPSVVLDVLPGFLLPATAAGEVFAAEMRGGYLALCQTCLARLFAGGRLFDDGGPGQLELSALVGLRRMSDVDRVVLELGPCIACSRGPSDAGGHRAT